MIRPNEIRKGNLLKYKGDIIKLIGIDQYDYVWFTMPHVTGSGFCDKIEIFEPIELTEEWLTKLGFKSFCKDWVCEGIIIHTRKRGYILKSSVPIIKSVHQLQNLYSALTGKELTIKQK